MRAFWRLHGEPGPAAAPAPAVTMAAAGSFPEYLFFPLAPLGSAEFNDEAQPGYIFGKMGALALRASTAARPQGWPWPLQGAPAAGSPQRKQERQGMSGGGWGCQKGEVLSAFSTDQVSGTLLSLNAERCLLRCPHSNPFKRRSCPR